jgi:predicted nucleotidyltransferase
MTELLDNQKPHLLPAEHGLEIFRCQVGSDIHGVTLSGYDDRDEMGICIEPPEAVIGLTKFEQWIYRTQAEGVRSGYGDLDLTVYSLRKWMRLALTGNPTVLMPLFVPMSEVVIHSVFSHELRRPQNVERILSKHTASRFLGYMQAQREQMLGLRGKKHTNRPELIAEYGFDTKFAYHMVRLGLQGVEMLTTGKVTLPIPPGERQWLRELRSGGHTMEEAVEYATALEAQLKRLRETSKLRDEPDRAWANKFLISAYESTWRTRYE